MKKPSEFPILTKALEQLELAKQAAKEASFSYLQSFVDDMFKTYPRLNKIKFSYGGRYEDGTMVDTIEVFFNDVDVEADQLWNYTDSEEILDQVKDIEEADELIKAAEHFELGNEMSAFLANDLFPHLEFSDDNPYGSGRLNEFEYVRK